SENGYLALPIALYNFNLGFTDDADVIDVNNSIQMPPMDCSSHSSVIIRFEQNFKRYGGSNNIMQVEVTVDDGVHWAYYDCTEGTISKQRPKDVGPGEPALFEANISDVAAGNNNVIIRLHWDGTDCYYWFLDDLSLAEAYDNDMQMLHTTMEFDRGVEGDDESVYYMIPKTQIGGGGFTNFEAGYRNFGELDQYNVILDVEVIKNNQQVFHAQSEPVNSYSLSDPDTITVSDIYSPTEFGHYRINMEYVSNAQDNYPDDNIKYWDFHITDSVYSRSGDINNYSYSPGSDYYVTPTEGWVDYSIFPIQADCEANSISIFLTGGDEAIDFNFVIVDPDVVEGESPYVRLTTELMDMDSSMHNRWLTLDLEKDGEGEFLTAGKTYYVGVQYWFDHEDEMVRRSNNLSLGSTRVMKLKNSVSGNSTDGISYDHFNTINYMIRLNINNHENIVDGIKADNALNSLDQNYPNPFTTLTEVNYELATGSAVTLEVYDITGRKVLDINEGYRSAGKQKIKINADNLESGVYYYTLVSDNFRETKRMVISR
ncbi:T9SS type A sorting domain-containing protein, partial [Bacteroidota bacterium]